MNPLDLSIVAVMVFLVIRGLMRGFFREIGSIAGVILGIWLANVYHPVMTGYIRGYLPLSGFLPLVSFAIIFTMVLVVCNLIGWGLQLLFKKTLFGWADRSLGIGLAVLKGIIITYLAIVLITFMIPSKSPLIAESKLAPAIVSSYQAMVSIISPGSYERWKEKLLRESGNWKSPPEKKSDSPAAKNGSE